MKIFAIAATALLATAAYAAPALVEARDPEYNVEVDFTSFAGAHFRQYFPADNSIQKITNRLSISKIHVIPSGYTGTFYGADGSITVVTGPGNTEVRIGLPQVSGKVRPS